MEEPTTNGGVADRTGNRPGDRPWTGAGMGSPLQKPGLPFDGRTIGVCLLLFAVVLWVFAPARRNGFIDWDDGLFVTENPQVRSGLTWGGLLWAFCNPVAANWHPLTVLSHMLDCEAYGVQPWGHHLTSILIHAANTVLVFLVFLRMTGAFWRCAVLAALFGLHPMRVESVVWVAERKDVLGAFFWMLTMLAYARYVQQAKVQGPKSAAAYGLTLLLFGCGLMCKPMLVTLPFVLLLLDYWPLSRIDLRTQGPRFKTLLPLVLEKLPFFVLAAAVSVVTFLTQAGTGAFVIRPSLGSRLANVAVSYVRYVGKLAWPGDLSVFYPYPAQWPAWQVVASAALLVVVFAAVLFQGRQRPYLAVGWFWFCGTLVPVIGLVQVGRQSMADRYGYVPLIGLLIILVWGVAGLCARWRFRAAALSAVTLAAALLCIAFTRRQIGFWRNDESLWRRAVAVAGECDLTHYNLGITLARNGALDEAIPHLREAIRISPGREDARASLAYALLKQQRHGESIREYEATLRLNPGNVEAHNNLGNLLLAQRRDAEAIGQFTEALRLNPRYPQAHYNLGAALARQGRQTEAAAHFREVLRLDPGHAGARRELDRTLAAPQMAGQDVEFYRQALQSSPGDARAHGNLGRALLEAGRVDEAVEQCAEAARLDPASAEAQYQLGVALSRKGEGKKAARQFDLALELKPDFAAAHYALGVVCQEQGRMPEALKHWREAARLAPQWPEPLNNLAWVLATDTRDPFRAGAEAVELASRAVALAGTNNARVLDTLAAAYAEAGRFEQASATARQAEAAATAQGQSELAGQLRRRLELYNSGQPYRQPPGTR